MKNDRRRAAAGWLLLSAIAAGPACSSRGDDPTRMDAGGPDAGAANDASGLTGDLGSGAAASDGGSPPSVTGTRSNIPGLKFEYKGTDAIARGLAILSSNLTQRTTGGRVYQEWLSEVENAGTATICLVRIRVRFQSAGTVLAEVDSFADGPPYESVVGGLTTTCLAPGDTGVFWDLDSVPNTTAIETATTAEYTIDHLPRSEARPHPDTPTVTITGVVDRFNTGDSWALRGSVTARTAIRNIGLDVYPIDDSGLIADALSATHIETLPAGATWTFDSSTTERRFSRQHVFPGWIDGARMAEPRPSDLPLLMDDLRRQFHDRRHQLKRERALLRLQ